MRLAIGIPSAKPYVFSPWQHWVENIVKYPPGSKFIKVAAMPVETARNKIVCAAKAHRCTHILFLDDDIWPLEADAVIRLLDRKKEIVGGLCKYRTAENKWVIFPQRLQEGEGLVEVEETGAGFLLVDMKVFDRVAGSCDFSHCQFFRWSGLTNRPTSEDITFCRIARTYGYKIYVDRDVLCGHHDIVVFDNSVKGFTQPRLGTKADGTIEKVTVSEVYRKT